MTIVDLSREFLNSNGAEKHTTASVPDDDVKPYEFAGDTVTEKLADIHAGLYDYAQIVTQQDMVDFIEIEFGRIGADTHITPREVIRDFIEVLDIVYQNPGISLRGLLGSDQFRYAQNAVKEEHTDDSLAEFEL